MHPFHGKDPALKEAGGPPAYEERYFWKPALEQRKAFERLMPRQHPDLPLELDAEARVG